MTPWQAGARSFVTARRYGPPVDAAASATVDWAALAAAHPALRLLVLLGSRATGTAHAASDWDLGYLAAADLDLGDLTADVSAQFGTDDVDVVDLSGASAVLRRDAAMVGRPLAEPEPGAFQTFQIEAMTFWCDVEPVLPEAQADVLRAMAGLMPPVDPAVLAERLAALERHLRRVADQLPDHADDLRPETEACDAVLLHLWQAVQITVDLALSWCVRAGLGAPPTYGEAFRRLASAGYLEDALASRLIRAVGFRNLLAHAYADLDLARVHTAATDGPADLRAFAAALLRNEGLPGPEQA